MNGTGDDRLPLGLCRDAAGLAKRTQEAQAVLDEAALMRAQIAGVHPHTVKGLLAKGNVWLDAFPTQPHDMLAFGIIQSMVVLLADVAEDAQ